MRIVGVDLVRKGRLVASGGTGDLPAARKRGEKHRHAAMRRRRRGMGDSCGLYRIILRSTQSYRRALRLAITGFRVVRRDPAAIPSETVDDRDRRKSSRTSPIEIAPRHQAAIDPRQRLAAAQAVARRGRVRLRGGRLGRRGTAARRRDLARRPMRRSWPGGRPPRSPGAGAAGLILAADTVCSSPARSSTSRRTAPTPSG